MKTSRIYRYAWLMILMTGWITAQGQYQQEVPGDNFSLEGALELFKASESPEAFEKKLNDPDSRVNNLDLNSDGYIDYIRVIDMYEGNVHAFVLQSVISHNEFQDIAVITLEKQANGQAVLQITGDADIYGVETIIEPTSEVRTYAGTTNSRVIVNVWSWPMVRYVYSPYYSVWVSPWGWGYRPRWWSPWRPVYYYDYYTYWRPYRRYYSVCYTHRVVYAHQIYAPHRTTSVIVHKQHNPTIVKYRTRYIDNDGSYRRRGDDRSYSRPTSNVVRYDANGRINSKSTSPENDRSYTSSREQSRTSGNYQRPSRTQNSYNPSGRSSNSEEIKTNRIQERPSSGRNNNSYNRGEMNERNYSSGSRNQSSDRLENRGTPANQGNGRTFERSSGSSQRSSSSPQVQRSSEKSNSSSIRRSTGSTNSQRYSGGSSNVQRSSENSSVQRSSGSSNASKSSGRSNVQRSGGSSNSQKSSGRSSSGSNSRGSSSSKSNSRNRN